MTETLPFTVSLVKGPIFMGDSPGLKLIGKVRCDNPFLKHVTEEGIGVDANMFGFQLIHTELLEKQGFIERWKTFSIQR